MSKGGGSTTSTTTYTQSPEQAAVTKAAMGHYMPDGKFVKAPTFDTSDPGIMKQGNERIAPLSQDTLNAHQAVRDLTFAHRPAINEAMDSTRQSMAPVGDKIGLGRGWSSAPATPSPDGSPFASAGQTHAFQDWNTDTASQYMNPYSANVTNVGMAELQRQHGLAQMDINAGRVNAGAFGGSRHGVQAAETTRGFTDMGQKFLAESLDRAYQQARGEYDTDYTRGIGAIGANNTLDAGNAARQLSGANQLGDLTRQRSDLDATSVNALHAVGGQLEGQDQGIRDAARGAQMEEFMTPAQLSSIMMGLAPPGSTTTTATKSGGGGLWGTVASAGVSSFLPALLGPLSDERLKEGVRDARPDEGLAQLRKVADKLKSYVYTEEGRKHGAPAGRRVGYMAQDVEKITGEQAPEGPHGYKMMDPNRDIGMLISSVAALDRKVDKLMTKSAPAKSGRRVA